MQKKPRLPHGFHSMIAQVLVVVGRNDGQELFQFVLESSQRRVGGFSAMGVRPFIKPLPFLWLRVVTVFLGSASSPTTVPGMVFGYLGKQLDFSCCFLLVDGLEPVPLRVWPFTCFFQSSLLLNVSASLGSVHFYIKEDEWLEWNKVKTKKPKYRATDLRWRTWASYRWAARVGFGPSQYQWKVSNVTNFSHVLSSPKKLHFSRETYGRS